MKIVCIIRIIFSQPQFSKENLLEFLFALFKFSLLVYYMKFFSLIETNFLRVLQNIYKHSLLLFILLGILWDVIWDVIILLYINSALN